MDSIAETNELMLTRIEFLKDLTKYAFQYDDYELINFIYKIKHTQRAVTKSSDQIYFKFDHIFRLWK